MQHRECSLDTHVGCLESKKQGVQKRERKLDATMLPTRLGRESLLLVHPQNAVGWRHFNHSVAARRCQKATVGAMSIETAAEGYSRCVVHREISGAQPQKAFVASETGAACSSQATRLKAVDEA